jgi:hypothetical protein
MSRSPGEGQMNCTGDADARGGAARLRRKRSAPWLIDTNQPQGLAWRLEPFPRAAADARTLHRPRVVPPGTTPGWDATHWSSEPRPTTPPCSTASSTSSSSDLYTRCPHAATVQHVCFPTSMSNSFTTQQPCTNPSRSPSSWCGASTTSSSRSVDRGGGRQLSDISLSVVGDASPMKNNQRRSRKRCCPPCYAPAEPACS